MTTEELQQIKAAAVKIHAAAVKAGKWDSKPEWEAKLMEIVCDISRAAEADKADRHTDWQYYDSYAEDGELADFYLVYTRGSVEDCLADAVIDILDTVEGVYPEWADEMVMSRIIGAAGFETGGCYELSFAAFCYRALIFNITSTTPYRMPTVLLDCLRLWSEVHGIDLRRHVELKMKYNKI